MTWMRGRKSYLIALLAGVLTALKHLGYIDEASYQTLLGLLGAGAVATVRAAIAKIEQ